MGETSFPALVIDAAGFSFRSGDESTVQVDWAAIVRVVAYKLDLLTTDEVRLEIALQYAPYEVTVSEEQPGFGAVAAEMEKRLNFPAGLWEAVVKPAFQANETVLYPRA